jgi:hypothetical protein
MCYKLEVMLVEELLKCLHASAGLQACSLPDSILGNSIILGHYAVLSAVKELQMP